MEIPDSYDQCEPGIILTHPINFPGGRKPEHPNKTVYGMRKYRDLNIEICEHLAR
jgi:hypothetical protein